MTTRPAHRRFHRFVLAATTAALILPTTGCSKEFCDERSLLGFMFCDPALVVEPSKGPAVSLRVHREGPDVFVGETVGFSAEVEGAGSPFYPAGYVSREEWDLDDDGTYEIRLDQGVGTRRKVFKFWDRSGQKTVRLRVTDIEGNTTERLALVRVTAEPGPGTSPRPSFTINPNPALPGEQVRFDATASSDPDGQIVDYGWNINRPREPFGADGQVVTHTFTTADVGSFDIVLFVFDIVLFVTDNDGLRKELSLPITVAREGPFDPIASFTATNHPTNPREVLLDATGSSDRDGQTVRYSWDLDGDGTYEIEPGEPSFSTTYARNGTYDVGLSVLDNDGRIASYTQRVVVDARSPEISLSASPNPSWVGEPVLFEAQVMTPGRTGVYHRWNLNRDVGFDREGASPATTWTYGFPDLGTFPVTVAVDDNFGIRGQKSIDMTVFESRPPDSGARLGAAGSRRPPARRFFARLDAQALSLRGARERRSRGRETVSGVRATGSVKGDLLADRLHGGERPAAPAGLADLLNARWDTRVDLGALLRGRRQTVKGVVLATPRRGRSGRVCIRLDLKRVGKRRPIGSWEVIGGTGKAARLRARGRVGFELRPGGKAALAGTVTAKSGKARRLPSACRALGGG